MAQSDKSHKTVIILIQTEMTVLPVPKLQLGVTSWVYYKTLQVVLAVKVSMAVILFHNRRLKSKLSYLRRGVPLRDALDNVDVTKKLLARSLSKLWKYFATCREIFTTFENVRIWESSNW